MDRRLARCERGPDEARLVVERVLAAIPGDPAAIREAREAFEILVKRCTATLSVLDAWIGRGLVVEAASVESSYPRLCLAAKGLDLGTEWQRWDDACTAAGVVPNTRIDAAALRRVSDAVADAALLEEPASRFQAGALGNHALRDRLRLLVELRSRARGNAAIADHERWFGQAVSANLEADCRAAEAAGNRAVLDDAAAVMDLLRDDGTKTRAFREWLASARARFDRLEADARHATLTDDMRRAREAGDLDGVNRALQAVDECNRAGMPLPREDHAAAIAEANRWRAEEQARRLRLDEFSRACGALEDAIDREWGADAIDDLEDSARKLGRTCGNETLPEPVAARLASLRGRRRALRQRLLRGGTAAVLLLAALTGWGVMHFRRQAERQRTVQRDLEQLLDRAGTEEFDSVRKLLDARRDPDSDEHWMHDVADPEEIERVREACSESDRRNRSRREEVRRALDRSSRAIEGPEDELESARTRVSDLLDVTEQFKRLNPEEDGKARDLLGRIDQERQRRASVRKAEAERQRREFEERIRAEIDACGTLLVAEPERPPGDRLNEVSTSMRIELIAQKLALFDEMVRNPGLGDAQRLDVENVRTKLRANQDEARRFLELLRKSGEFERRAAQARTGIQLQEALRGLANECRDVVRVQAASDARLAQRMYGLAESTVLASAAVALDDWAQSVEPLLRGPVDTAIRLPGDPAKASAILQAVGNHLRVHPASPMSAAAGALGDWLRAVIYLPSGGPRTQAISQGLLAGLRLDAMDGLQQARVAGYGGPTFYVFFQSRRVEPPEDVELRPIAGALLGLDNLGSAPLRTKSDLGPLVPVARSCGGRQQVPFARPIEGALKGTAELPPPGPSALAAQSAWLRAIGALRDLSLGNPDTDALAPASIALAMAERYVSTAAASGAAAKELRDTLTRLLNEHKETIKQARDWPRLAALPGRQDFRDALRKQLLEVVSLIPPNLAERAGEIEREWSAVAEDCMAPRFVGVLQPAGDDGMRRVADRDAGGQVLKVIDVPSLPGEPTQFRIIRLNGDVVPTDALRASAGAYVPIVSPR
jgi:hypothetical protein